MKRTSSAILLFWALRLAVAAQPDAPPGPAERYARAQQAYDASQFEEARIQYEQLLAQGYVAPEVRFNLGNTLYRQGALGPAVAQYRMASYARPRDPDIRANLAIAQQQVGSLVPATDGWDRIFRHFSRAEWTRLALAGYWWTALAGAAYFLRHRSRRWRNGALAGLLAGLLGWAGLMYWNALRRSPEAVVTRSGVQALFAPMPDAVVHFPLPEGSIVRVRDQSGSWLKIEVARQEGWIPDAACERLSHP